MTENPAVEWLERDYDHWTAYHRRYAYDEVSLTTIEYDDCAPDRPSAREQVVIQPMFTLKPDMEYGESRYLDICAACRNGKHFCTEVKYWEDRDLMPTYCARPIAHMARNRCVQHWIDRYTPEVLKRDEA